MEFTEKNPVLNIVRKFFWSRNYPLCLLAVAVISHISGLDLVGYTIFALCGVFINLFLSDTRPMFPTFIIGGTCTSAINAFGKGEASAFYSSPFTLVTLFSLGALVVISMIAHIVLYKRYRGAWAKLKSPVALSIAVLCVAIMLGGVGSNYYDANAVIVPLVFTALIVAVYLYTKLCIDKREDNIDYFAYCILLMGVGVACQVLSFYAFNYRGQELDSAWKDSLLLGAYVSNSAGEMIVITLPVFFYFASKRSKGWLYVIGAIVMVGVVALTLSRASLLFAVPVFIFGLVWCCFRSKSVKFFRIFTLSCVCLGVVAVIGFFALGGLDKLGGFFGDTGLADRGRFSLWSQMLTVFTQFPLLGGGFSALYQLNNHAQGSVNIYTALAHNTIFQMIGSCGIVGILAYVFHRYITVRLFTKRFSADRLFMGVTALTLILIGLLDQIFFFPHFIILYALVLGISEIDYDGTAEKTKEKSEVVEETADNTAKN